MAFLKAAPLAGMNNRPAAFRRALAVARINNGGDKANGSVLGEGGGIYNSNSSLTLMKSIVKGNKATTAFNDIFGP